MHLDAVLATFPKLLLEYQKDFQDKILFVNLSIKDHLLTVPIRHGKEITKEFSHTF